MSVSLRDIAERAGVSTAAVSQALRGIGRISPATRERIRAIARELDYHPDPLISRAFSRVRQPEARAYRETIAFILEWELPRYLEGIFHAASERASALGYRLDPFVVSGRPSEHRRMSQILRTRGIRGLIIAQRLGSPQPRLYFDWQHFTAVELGGTLRYPRTLHRVQSAGYQTFPEAIHLLKRVGYRRIGMAIEPAQNRHQNGVYYAAYLLYQLRRPRRERIPIFAPTGPWNETTFRRWITRYQPDVLLVHRFELIREWLERMGLRVPEDISLFGVNAPHAAASGLRRDVVEIAHSAVDMVSIGLSNGEFGIPRHPRIVLIDELWQAGKSLSRPIDSFISPDGCLERMQPASQRARPGIVPRF
jgi:Transcriptional regulators